MDNNLQSPIQTVQQQLQNPLDAVSLQIIQTIIDSYFSSKGIYFGSGTPESQITANVGSIFLRSDGGTSTSFYVKESGISNTGWVAK